MAGLDPAIHALPQREAVKSGPAGQALLDSHIVELPALKEGLEVDEAA